MARQLEITHQDASALFTLTKITRSNLYGRKKRIPVDCRGRPCTRAALTRDGRFVLTAGTTASVYLDEAGDSVERSEIGVVGEDGRLLDAEQSSFDHPVVFGNPVASDALLDCTIMNVYALDPVTIPPSLDMLLTDGNIFRFPFRFKAGSAEHTGFLLKNQVGYFLLVGRAAGFGFIGLEEADISLSEDDEERLDVDLDFSML
jgi:hypothetical protein